MARPPIATLAAFLALAAAAGASISLEAQAADTMEVAEARELIAEGAHGAAAEELASYLERYPDDVGVRWLLARTLYWDGDYRAARVELRRVLARDPGYGPALELWREMRTLWAARLRAGGELHTDDQPLDRQAAELALELPVSARVAVLARGSGGRLDAPRPGDVGTYEGRLGIRATPRGAPLEVELLGGVHARPALDRTELVGTGRLSLSLQPRLEAGLEVGRWAYPFTAGAVDSAVLVESVEAGLSLNDPVGPAGAVGGRLDRFPAGGVVHHAWLWALAPLWSDGRSAVRLGYAFQYQDADTTTFRLAASPEGDGPGAPAPPAAPPSGPPGGTDALEGVYAPYYTPEEVRAHMALGAFQAALSPTVTLSADGGIGLFAREEAPAFVADTVDGAATPGAPVLRFGERDYTPWRVRGRLSADLSPALTLRLEGTYREEAFFQTGSAIVGLEWRFLGGLARP